MRHLLLLIIALAAPSVPAQQGEPPVSDVEEAIAADSEAAETAESREQPTGPVAFEWLREPGYDTVVCPFRDEVDYERGDIECGLIQVPENREVEGSRTIELHFVKINARGENDDGDEVEVRDDPVIYLTGGPGVTVTGYVERLKDHGVADGRDLYILEQRGIGYSGDFCPFFADRNRADYQADNFIDSQRAMFEQARVCIEGARARGVDVTGYHTFENARDIKALRLALGLEDWNVWGISYGSVLGQAYMKVDPEGIRAAVIDAIVPLDLRELMRIPHWHTRNLDKLFTACSEQPACAAEFEGLERRYRAAISQLTENPIRVDVPEGERYPDGETWFFGDLIAGLPFSLLYEQSNHPAVPAIMDGLARAVEDEDESFFRALALADTSGGFGISMGMSVAVRCLDGYVDRWAESAPGDFRDYPVLARAFGALEVIEEAPETCREVGLVPRDAAQFELVETDLPVVVANGAWDPITPVPLAEAIMPGFSNGRLVVFPHAGHGPTRSLDCAGDFLNAFFDDPSAELDMECVKEGEDAAEYVAPYFRTDFATDGIVLYEEHETRFKLHMAWAGASAAIVVAGLVVLFLAWLARRINARRLPAAGGSRMLTFLATLAAVVHAAGMGLAVKASTDITEAMVLFGLVSWAAWVAWFAPVSLLLGLLGLLQTWRYRDQLEPSSVIGLAFSGLGVVSLSLVTLVWGLWPL
ncbi:MAG: alpha/beta fold hydrolase [Xanthomonadales bacterium]|nr:alpha/beta fold hydrolase [Xanthomonadales bacterium]